MVTDQRLRPLRPRLGMRPLLDTVADRWPALFGDLLAARVSALESAPAPQVEPAPISLVEWCRQWLPELRRIRDVHHGQGWRAADGVRCPCVICGSANAADAIAESYHPPVRKDTPQVETGREGGTIRLVKQMARGECAPATPATGSGPWG